MQGFVAGYQHLEPSIFRRIEKFAIFQPREPGKGSRRRFVLLKMVPQWMRQILVQQHLHGVN